MCFLTWGKTLEKRHLEKSSCIGRVPAVRKGAFRKPEDVLRSYSSTNLSVVVCCRWRIRKRRPVFTLTC